MSGSGVLTLRDGWLYKGEYVSNLFHGFGSLYHHNQLIYSGNFEFGYFHGHGKLQYHPSFDYLIQLKTVHNRLNNNQEECQWTAYFGEFSKGNISGYG